MNPGICPFSRAHPGKAACVSKFQRRLNRRSELFEYRPTAAGLVFVAASKLWLRPLDSLESKALEGTDGASYPSPNSESIGFFAQGKLIRIPRSRGLLQTICEAGSGRGAR